MVRVSWPLVVFCGVSFFIGRQSSSRDFALATTSPTTTIVKQVSEDFIYVGFDHALGEKRNVTADNQKPPSEGAWLLSPVTSKPSHSGKSDSRIPPIINKIYFQKDGNFPTNANEQLKEAHKSWTSLNPGYNIRYFNLRLARKYLQQHYHPVFLRAFDCIEAFASKSDFFRMCLLYREGGFHSDWKQVCLQRHLLDRIANSTDFFAALDIGNGYTQKSMSCAQNAFVGATPGHEIVAKYLELALQNVHDKQYAIECSPTTWTLPTRDCSIA